MGMNTCLCPHDSNGFLLCNSSNDAERHQGSMMWTSGNKPVAVSHLLDIELRRQRAVDFACSWASGVWQ